MIVKFEFFINACYMVYGCLSYTRIKLAKEKVKCIDSAIYLVFVLSELEAKFMKLSVRGLLPTL